MTPEPPPAPVFRLLLMSVLGSSLLTACALCFGPSLRDAPHIELAPTPEQVERGRYLSEQLLGCTGCHSPHNWQKYLDGPTGPAGSGGDCWGPNDHVNYADLPGRVCPPNITSDDKRGVGAWTDGELLRAIREGVDREGNTLFPVMPYGNYKNLSDDDALAVIAYVRTLPPSDNKVPETVIEFPVSRFINFAPQPIQAPIPTPDLTDELTRGRYMVLATGCKQCHTQLDGHDIDESKLFAGGRRFTTRFYDVRSANITPDDTGLGPWDKQQFIDKFAAFREETSDGHLGELGTQSPMPWRRYAGLTDADLGAMYIYLQTLPAIANEVNTTP